MRNFNKQTKWRLFQLPCAGAPEHSTASARRRESGEWTRPSSSSRSKHGVDSAAHPCSARVADKAMDSQHYSSHHQHQPRATVDHRSLPSPSRATVCPLHLALQSTTITVIQSPARLASEDDSSQQVCWARQRLSTQLQVTGRLCIGCRPGRMWCLGSCRLGKGWPTQQDRGIQQWRLQRGSGSSSAMTWFRDCFWGWECDIAEITHTY